MTRYSSAFKARVVQRLVGPRAVSANRLASEVGVPQETLSRWLRATRSVDGMTRGSRATKWTSAEKLRVVIAAQALSETDLGAVLRREGLHAAQLTAWQATIEAALAAPRPHGMASVEGERIVALERELRRKDRALAETAALLVLKKTVWARSAPPVDPETPRRYVGQAERNGRKLFGDLEPVKKHGPGEACALASGDARRAIPFRKMIDTCPSFARHPLVRGSEDDGAQIRALSAHDAAHDLCAGGWTGCGLDVSCGRGAARSRRRVRADVS